MEKHQITIDIAAYGWQTESWQGFYPADLPEDWQLDFYSNEFRAVVVPVDVRQKMTTDMLKEWQDAVHDEFRFYFETTDGHLSMGSDSIDFSVGDVIPSIWYDGAAEPRLMRDTIEQLQNKMGNAARGVVVVNATDEPWEVASDMRQLVELMGYG